MTEQRRAMVDKSLTTFVAGYPRQRGAAAILFTLLLVVMIGMLGMALDLAQLYNRKAEVQGLADAVAMAAAPELIGTSAGIASALAKAATTAGGFKYRYSTSPVGWAQAAIKFSASPTTADSAWLDAASAQATPSGLLFVKVDTTALAAELGTVQTGFMGALSSALASASTGGRAIAGRSTINVTPLAICALSATPAFARNNPGTPAKVELVEYGFRRGVAYDLMQLNPNATTAENFVVDPIDALGTFGSAGNLSAAVVGPFVCAGKMPMATVMGAAITVGRPFPLGSLFNQLNSRFDQYNGAACSPNGAPPDFNIKSYTYNTSIAWMAATPGAQTAGSSTFSGKLWTKADPLPALGTNTAPDYGPLWSFAKAVPFSAYTAGVPEPSAGYTPFPTTAWATLYQPGAPSALSYPAVTPYMTSSGANFLSPSLANKPGLRYRRVLNVPLLSCPVGGGATVSATVLAVGKFFMTVPATATSIYAEFAGVAPEQALGGAVDLYP